MFRLVCFAFAFFFYTNLYATDFRPYVKLVCHAGDQTSEYSGVVFREDDTHYHIVTCEHGTLQQSKSVIRLKAYLFPIEDQEVVEVAVKAQLIKDDRDIDVALVTIPKVDNVTVKPMKLADAIVVGEPKGISYGYAQGKFIPNPVQVSTKEKFQTYGGKAILLCDGEVINGMSGGPLVISEQVFGIQSSGAKAKRSISYCPSDIVWEFIGRSNGN